MSGGIEPTAIVVYPAHPEWGAGVVRRVEPDGRLLVDFEIDGRLYSDDFHAQELEEYDRWTAARAAA